MMFTSDISDRYFDLIKGLDPKSILTVSRIIARIQSFRLTGSSFFIFSEDEIREIAEIYDSHSSNFLRLDSSHFCYGRYILLSDRISTQCFVYRHFVDEIDCIEALRARDVIDAGAYVGDSAIILSEEFHSDVYSFEPNPVVFSKLQACIVKNGLHRVRALPLALSDRSGVAELQLNDDGSSLESSEPHSTLDRVQIATITIDEFVAKNNLNIGLIRVDVEGHELALLRGALHTIKNHRPALILSIYHSAHDFFNLKLFLENLNLGYTFKIRKPSDYSVICDTVLIASPPKST